MSKKYGLFSDNGTPTAFYSDDFNVIPNGAILLTDEQWQNLCDNPGKRVWESHTSSVIDFIVPLEEAREIKKSNFTNICANAIINGYSSEALGAAHMYASLLTDQANLVQTASASSGGELWCADANNKWEFIVHTQVQAQQVLTDFIVFRSRQQHQLATIITLVNSAMSQEEIESIAWSN